MTASDAPLPLPPDGYLLRRAEPRDLHDIQSLISGCYADAGFPFDLEDDFEAHVRAPHTYFTQRGGDFFTLRHETTGHLAATAALQPQDAPPLSPPDERDHDAPAGALIHRSDHLNFRTIYVLTESLAILDRTVELKSLYVDPRHRRRGLASFLTDLVIARARTLERAAVVLWSDVELPDAHKLYDALRFRRIGYRDIRGRHAFRELGFAINL